MSSSTGTASDVTATASKRTDPPTNGTPTVFYDSGPGGKSIGRQTLTKYELTRLRGVRLEQLARGAFGTVRLTSELQTIEDVVDAEIQQRSLPFIIMRNYPNGDQRAYRVRYMNVVDYTKPLTHA